MDATTNVAPLLQVKSVRQAFPKPDGSQLLVLDDLNLDLAEGEIVGLLGRSGSGKSTLLRLIAGLARPSGGNITYLGRPVVAPAPGVAMVFQSFALFPWMTVLENVQLGLEALGLPEAEFAGAPSRRSTLSASMDTSPPIRASSQGACASASASRARWSCIRISC